MAVIGWVLAAIAGLIFVMGVVGLMYPPALKDPKTGVAPKRWQMLLLAWLGPVLPGAIAFGLLMASAERIDYPQAVNAVDHGFAMSPEQFRKRYNTHISDVDSNWRLAELDVIPGEKTDVFRRDLEGVFILGSVDKSTGLVREITVGLGGGNSDQSLRGLVALLSAANAVTDGVSRSEVSEAVMKVAKQALNDIETSDAGLATEIVGNRKFSALASKQMGLVFVISSRD